MNYLNWNELLFVVVIGLALPGQGLSLSARDLNAACRDGQVFITWTEDDTPAGTTFNVYAAAEPITQSALPKAVRVGHHIEPHSARDWWQDPASFKKDAKAGTPAGFIIERGGIPLNPRNGLFVHTVTPETEKLTCYAVTACDPQGQEINLIVPGQNALKSPVQQKTAPVQPVWLAKRKEPVRSDTEGKPLRIELHGRGGGLGRDDYLVFGGANQGWREGLPYKFNIQITPDAVIIDPSDKVWINRPLMESADVRDHVPAIETFWYGYNSLIYDAGRMPEGVATDYTEQRFLWICDWAQNHLGIDVNRISINGDSMGGAGAIFNALHHPERYAAAYARVPFVAFTRPGAGSAKRVEYTCGPQIASRRGHNGALVLDYLNGPLLVKKAQGDLPFLFMMNGRQDGSVPWENNPPFYKALQEARQGFVAYWDNGGHSMPERNDLPEDLQAWIDGNMVLTLALNRSFPAFAHCSTDKDPGNGDPANGDIIGWMNRGLSWKDIEDTPEKYAISLRAAFPGITYPVKVDMTLRRVQRFKVKRGDKINVQVGNAKPMPAAVDHSGLITVPGIEIPSQDYLRVVITR